MVLKSTLAGRSSDGSIDLPAAERENSFITARGSAINLPRWCSLQRDGLVKATVSKKWSLRCFSLEETSLAGHISKHVPWMISLPYSSILIKFFRCKNARSSLSNVLHFECITRSNPLTCAPVRLATTRKQRWRIDCLDSCKQSATWQNKVCLLIYCRKWQRCWTPQHLKEQEITSAKPKSSSEMVKTFAFYPFNFTKSYTKHQQSRFIF